MRYYLIAGEASGDLHGASLMKALQGEDKAAFFRFWGGDLMAAVGGKLVKHYRELAFMGFVEVLKNLPAIRNNFRLCKKDILAFRPDVLILIDYSGFNLRIAKWAKEKGVRVFYYIAPQVWASRPHRALVLKRYVDQLFVILPFEPAFYQKYGMEVHFVGHPLLDVLNPRRRERMPMLQTMSLPVIALLPGSRRQEISRVLKIFLPLAKRFKNFQFVIAAAPAIPLAFYQQILKREACLDSNIQLIQGEVYAILRVAKAALVTSGTATLETALFNVPQVVCYKGSWLSFQIAKRLIRVPYISLVNLILNRPLVTELIQYDLTVEQLEEELVKILDPKQAAFIQEGYAELTKALGEKGASKRVAQTMVRYFRQGTILP